MLYIATAEIGEAICTYRNGLLRFTAMTIETGAFLAMTLE